MCTETKTHQQQARYLVTYIFESSIDTIKISEGLKEGKKDLTFQLCIGLDIECRM